MTCSLEIPLRSADRYLIKFTPAIEANNRASTGMASERPNQKKKTPYTLLKSLVLHWPYMESFANVGDKLRFHNSVLMYLSPFGAEVSPFPE